MYVMYNPYTQKYIYTYDKRLAVYLIVTLNKLLKIFLSSFSYKRHLIKYHFTIS